MFAIAARGRRGYSCRSGEPGTEEQLRSSVDRHGLVGRRRVGRDLLANASQIS